MEFGAAPVSRTVTGEITAVIATQLAAVCDEIREHHNAGTPISARRAAAISAMIDDIATAARGRPRSTGRRQRLTTGSSPLYEEVCRLGEGGGGVVIRARHSITGQAVAVKSLHLRRGGGLGHLLREACFMAACQGHTSIVTLHGVTRHPGPDGTMDYSLVMEYVGPSLVDVLQDRGRPFPKADVRGIMRQLLAASEAMHRRGIVHRDIKTDNILVGDGGAVKICDFGGAKTVAEQDPPLRIAGTIDFMAPEALVGNTDHGTLVDSWSLGCVMAELLTDGLLFSGEEEEDQIYEIFDVLGVPDERAWQELKPRILTDDVQQWRTQQRLVGHRNRLRELVRAELLSDDGFEVLAGLLTCDLKKRLTVADALRCPCFIDNVDDARLPGTAILKIGAIATTSWSRVKSFVGRALGACNCLGRRSVLLK